MYTLGEHFGFDVSNSAGSRAFNGILSFLYLIFPHLKKFHLLFMREITRL